jgi:hypothetical protein
VGALEGHRTDLKRRDKILKIRVSANELEALRAGAELNSMSVSEYVRAESRGQASEGAEALVSGATGLGAPEVEGRQKRAGKARGGESAEIVIRLSS